MSAIFDRDFTLFWLPVERIDGFVRRGRLDGHIIAGGTELFQGTERPKSAATNAHASRHCEERSDEAIQSPAPEPWIASLRSQ
jgi:hypothetical protein